MMAKLIALMLSLLSLCSNPLIPASRTFYMSAMEVVAIEESQTEDGCWEQKLTLEKAVGYQYRTTETNTDYSVGDIVVCMMANNGTDFIDDDIIIKLEYSGYVKGDLD